ncbi:MAG TPA: alpha-ketoglutarate-dependent dioxygenase AlkB [Casimicrobiaceae bacterium]|nr:alpha-ketoglutarate-dependent dioxygenase AlkB [Casimicrobiaceae bacterium]
MQWQRDLLEPADLHPQGLDYRPEFLTADEEAALIDAIASLPLSEAKYRGFTAKRRTVHFGFGYDFSANRLQPAPDLPDFLRPVRAKAARWAALPDDEFVQGLVTEYRPGTPIGWHRDVPQFGVVAGISLGSACRMRFRPYPPSCETSRRGFTLTLEPRSAYTLKGAIRWEWQHSIPEVSGLRWSITFRTMRRR